ncbi:hypothetical protein EVAR_96629_1 [Eumeta japonica]|uniref:Uncharacterized protein n=1 Tax=Eumeta variegata TaxID=151549 RepID=A0A4C1WRR7_EUMVA|nr:hypothetical protein EVAR_96629_1 [Eumeta japonica]
MLALYADDSAYLASSRRADFAAAKLQRVLDLLPDWLDRWRVAHEDRPSDRPTACHATKAETPGQEVEWQTRVRPIAPCMLRHVIHQSGACCASASIAPAAPSAIRSRLTYAAPA